MAGMMYLSGSRRTWTEVNLISLDTSISKHDLNLSTKTSEPIRADAGGSVSAQRGLSLVAEAAENRSWILPLIV